MQAKGKITKIFYANLARTPLAGSPFEDPGYIIFIPLDYARDGVTVKDLIDAFDGRAVMGVFLPQEKIKDAIVSSKKQRVKLDEEEEQRFKRLFNLPVDGLGYILLFKRREEKEDSDEKGKRGNISSL